MKYVADVAPPSGPRTYEMPAIADGFSLAEDAEEPLKVKIGVGVGNDDVTLGTFSHSMQLVEPKCGAHWYAGHGVHAAAPELEYVSTGQGVATVAQPLCDAATPIAYVRTGVAGSVTVAIGVFEASERAIVAPFMREAADVPVKSSLRL